jgi:hypothetical protein
MNSAFQKNAFQNDAFQIVEYAYACMFVSLEAAAAAVGLSGRAPAAGFSAAAAGMALTGKAPALSAAVKRPSIAMECNECLSL